MRASVTFAIVLGTKPTAVMRALLIAMVVAACGHGPGSATVADPTAAASAPPQGDGWSCYHYDSIPDGCLDKGCRQHRTSCEATLAECSRLANGVSIEDRPITSGCERTSSVWCRGRNCWRTERECRSFGDHACVERTDAMLAEERKITPPGTHRIKLASGATLTLKTASDWYVGSVEHFGGADTTKIYLRSADEHLLIDLLVRRSGTLTLQAEWAKLTEHRQEDRNIDECDPPDTEGDSIAATCKCDYNGGTTAACFLSVGQTNGHDVSMNVLFVADLGDSTEANKAKLKQRIQVVSQILRAATLTEPDVPAYNTPAPP